MRSWLAAMVAEEAKPLSPRRMMRTHRHFRRI
jgi:hypothetical protein